MAQKFQAGDFLIFQVESGYGLLRLLAITENDGEKIWHLSAYNELFLDAEFVDMALENPQVLTVSISHVALTERAFLSTQTARMSNVALNVDELKGFDEWMKDETAEISDRSIRLLLGLR